MKESTRPSPDFLYTIGQCLDALRLARAAYVYCETLDAYVSVPKASLFHVLKSKLPEDRHPEGSGIPLAMVSHQEIFLG